MRALAIPSPAPLQARRNGGPKSPENRGSTGLVNRRPDAIAQRKLAEFIRTSPRVVAQAKWEAALRQESTQRVETGVSRQLPHAKDQAGMKDDKSLQLKQASSPLQRLESDDEALQKQAAAFPVQRLGPEEEEPIQAMSAAEEPPAQLKKDQRPRGNSTGMPDQLKAGIESLSGLDMSDVRVHRNSAQPARLNALAYAQGNDIHLAPGQDRHLPHEAWHVVQQRQGRVKPTLQAKGVSINDEPALEKEADAMGARAVQRVAAANSSLQPIAQRVLKIKSDAGVFTYNFGHDFQHDHVGGKGRAIAVLKQRWKEQNLAGAVTTIAELDGDHEATDLKPVSGYDFSISIDVTGWTASWDAKNKPVAVSISSATLSGYIKGNTGLITHISSTD